MTFHTCTITKGCPRAQVFQGGAYFVLELENGKLKKEIKLLKYEIAKLGCENNDLKISRAALWSQMENHNPVDRLDELHKNNKARDERGLQIENGNLKEKMETLSLKLRDRDEFIMRQEDEIACWYTASLQNNSHKRYLQSYIRVLQHEIEYMKEKQCT